jgi:hypothetical protein
MTEGPFIFDPVPDESNVMLCAEECTHKAPGTLHLRWAHCVEFVWCLIMRQPFSSLICDVFDERLEVFQDGLRCKIKRCHQCVNAWQYLRPVSALTGRTEQRAPLLPPARLERTDADIEESMRKAGKGHHIDALDGKQNVRPIRRLR